MISITSSLLLGSNFSAQVVVPSSGRQHYMTIECSTRALPERVHRSYAFARIPMCLIESNLPFTTTMRYANRQHPEPLPTIEYAGEYSCAFPLWSDAVVQVRCDVVNFTLHGSLVQPALSEEAGQ